MGQGTGKSASSGRESRPDRLKKCDVARKSRADSAILNPRPIKVTLDRNVLLEFKIALFRMDVSVNEVFEEFAYLVANGDESGMKIVKRVVKRKFNAPTETRSKRTKSLERNLVSENDAEMLYDFLEDEKLGRLEKERARDSETDSCTTASGHAEE